MSERVNLTPEDLLRVYTNPQIPNVPDISQARAISFADALAVGLPKYGIDNRRAAAHWLAQSGYETGCLNWLEEFEGAQQARIYHYSGGPTYYGRGTAMLTHDYNYAAIAKVMLLPELETKPGVIGCQNDDPVGWPRRVRPSLESGMAYWQHRNLGQYARLGDDGFDPIMRAWLGTTNHPSYWDRWALYRAAIEKLPRPLEVISG